jgi:hypothetical protein
MSLCPALEDILNGCDRNTGGLHEIYVGLMDDISAITEVESSWSVTAMTVTSAPITIEVKRKTSNYTSEETNDFVNGSNVVTTTVTANLHRRSADKSKALNILSSGQRYLYAFLKDANGLFWYVPYLQLATNGGGSGQERADGSNYTVTLIAEDDHTPYVVDAAIVAAALAVS